MKLLTVSLTILALSGIAAAYADCGNVYDPMSGQWVYTCSLNPQPGSQPQCHNEYDPMNQRWVLVCG
jgi:hypothetical protein